MALFNFRRKGGSTKGTVTELHPAHQETFLTSKSGKKYSTKEYGGVTDIDQHFQEAVDRHKYVEGQTLQNVKTAKDLRKGAEDSMFESTRDRIPQMDAEIKRAQADHRAAVKARKAAEAERDNA